MSAPSRDPAPTDAAATEPVTGTAGSPRSERDEPGPAPRVGGDRAHSGADADADADAESAGRRVLRYFEPHRGGRFASLDGYRAIAAIGVLIFHVGGAPTSDIANNGTLIGGIVGNLGNFGVATFFLLSGFLLYRPYVASHFSNDHAPGTVRFYRHRFLRIFPAYWLALTGWFVLVWSALPEGRRMSLSPDNLLTVYGFAQIYRPLFAFSALATAWTLCIEVTFYLVLPLIAWLIRDVIGAGARSLRNRLRVQVLGIAALIALGWIFRITVVGTYAVAPVGTARDSQHLWLPNFFDWFGLGMLLAVAICWRDSGGRLPPLVRQLANNGWLSWLIAGGIYLILVTIRQQAPEVAAGADKETLIQLAARMLLNGLAAFFFLLPGIVGTNNRSWISRGLSSVVPAYLGTISYGIYLWHKVFLDWLLAGPKVRWGFWPMLVAVFVLTVIVASASWFLVERPLMRFKDPHTRPTARSPGAAVA